MIRYALRCDRDHEFEMWFRSSGDYDRSRKARRVECPDCGSTAIVKAPMAPAVAGTHREEKMPVAAPDPRKVALREAMMALRKQVIDGADYVGPRFAEEARKIHYNEVEARGIYGEASGDEAKALAEEGIGFMPLPPGPEDLN
jgi:hypothetical protein